jgi:hypothetical protein
VTAHSRALFIGGRAGVGKSRAGYEIHAQLSAARVQHCLIEGDNLDLAWPVPHENGFRLAEQNLAAMWANYRALGYRRMIYTNTASVSVTTDSRPVTDIAAEIIALTGWTNDQPAT